ncbi:hypothetical protein [Promicromonospora soli]
MRDAILLIVGVVVGILGDEVYGALKARLRSFRNRRSATQFDRSTDPAIHAENICQILDASGRAHLLYRPATIQDGPLVPVMPDRDDILVGPLDPTSDMPVRLESLERDELPYSASLVRKMRQGGLNIWDGAICYAPAAPFTDSVLSVRVCNYFAYVDFGNRLLNESRTTTGKKPILAALTDFQTALGGSLKPALMAVATTCVFDDADGHVVALHRRSGEVVNARNLVSVIPSFALEPSRTGSERSRYGILTYNLLKGIVEEFFDEEDVAHAGDQLRPSPDWVFRSQDGRKLIDELDAGRVAITCTGASIELSDGTLQIALLAHFSSADYLRELKLSIKGNWEGSPVGPPIEFVPLEGDRIDKLLASRELVPMSAYSLDRARQAMRKTGPAAAG